MRSAHPLEELGDFRPKPVQWQLAAFLQVAVGVHLDDVDFAGLREPQVAMDEGEHGRDGEEGEPEIDSGDPQEREGEPGPIPLVRAQS